MDCMESYQVSNSSSTFAQQISVAEKSSRRKPCSWKAEEDQRLLDGVNKYGKSQWVLVSQYVGTRSRKQCRERYVNHTSPDIKELAWSRDDDLKLLQLVKRIGCKWSKLTVLLEGRSSRSIRNRYRRLMTVQKAMSCFTEVDKSTYSVISMCDN